MKNTKKLKKYMKSKNINTDGKFKKLKVKINRKRSGLPEQRFTGGGLSSDGGDGSGDGAAGAGAVGESLLSELFSGMGMSNTVVPNTATSNIFQTVFANSDGKDEPVDKKIDNAKVYRSKNRFRKDDSNRIKYPEEEAERQVSKFTQSEDIFKMMYDKPDIERADIIDTFKRVLNVTDSTAVTYYTKLIEKYGLNKKKTEEEPSDTDITQQPEVDQTERPVDFSFGDSEDENMDVDDNEISDDAVVRYVDNAHLVYKRKTGDGTYEELWIYNIDDLSNNDMKIRHQILAGTDIPQNKTSSADGVQTYHISTMGNAQMLHIMGLPN